MRQAELNVVSRETRKNTALRAAGMVPATIYGPGLPNTICAFSEKELRKLFKGDFESNVFLNLKSPVSTLNGKKVVLKSIDRHPASWNVIHADFYEVALTRPLEVKLSLHFTGTPEDVKNGTGILQTIRRSIRVKALPDDLPEYIEVDISGLQMGKGLHVGDLKISDKLKVMDSAEFAVISVVEPEKEEVVAAPTAEAAAGAEGAAAAPAAADAKAGDAKAADAKAPAKPAKA